jgi:hypothetical protein
MMIYNLLNRERIKDSSHTEIYTIITIHDDYMTLVIDLFQQ